MADDAVPFLDARALARLARSHTGEPCTDCASLRLPGWESLSATFDTRRLRKVGTLRSDPAAGEPTHQEYHPQGTNAWSADAPIAPAFFPYNRCDAWQCVRCGRAFLRYTEYGGYYVEQRIRPLQAALLVDASL